MTRLAAAARVVFLHALCDGLHLSLLAVRTWDGGNQSDGKLACRSFRGGREVWRWSNCTSELQTPQLESDQPVADLDEVDQGIEVVGSQNETVSGAVVAPSAQHEIATK